MVCEVANFVTDFKTVIPEQLAKKITRSFIEICGV